MTYDFTDVRLVAPVERLFGIYNKINKNNYDEPVHDNLVLIVVAQIYYVEMQVQ